MAAGERRLSAFSRGPTPPSNPFFGEKWLNTNNMTEYEWNGGSWENIAGPILFGLLGIGGGSGGGSSGATGSESKSEVVETVKALQAYVAASGHVILIARSLTVAPPVLGD